MISDCNGIICMQIGIRIYKHNTFTYKYICVYMIDNDMRYVGKKTHYSQSTITH